MSAPNPRKRAAPGAAPIMPIPQRMQQPYVANNVVGDPLLQWNASDAAAFVDGNVHGANPYGLVQAQQQYQQPIPNPSNSLARRQMNNALIPANPRPNFDSAVEPWTDFGDNALLQQTPGENLVAQDSIEVLEEMAQKAKREAQNKRKHIPPFVQKLSSFLEEGKNEDLIRWSEKGDSFIVLDEAEFANTLIPELFKHKNYASFVRQLNMYGFHKRVGLSDNSMRASERKNKSPNEYSNPFFRRGHPNLLWLINKPKSKAKKGGKNGDGEGDSDEEPGHEDTVGQGRSSTSAPPGRSLPSTDDQPLPKKEMSLIREEINKVREQQKLILGAINRLQRNNNDLYNQAIMFQSQHDRHQNSINAILNFLANVFRKTLEDQGNTQSVSDIISSMITSQGQQPAHQGSVVDLGDFFQNQMDAANPLGGGPPKRARGLLPPIPNQEVPQASRSPSTSSTAYHGMSNQNPQMGHVTELVDASPAESSPSLRQELENNPHERMMKIINDHNATNASGMDLPEAAELVANAPNTLNNDQRSKLVDFMAGQSSSSASTPMPSTSGHSGFTPRSKAPSRSPPPMDGGAPSLSPIMRSPPMPTPSLHQIGTNQMDLDQLHRLQSEQDAKISELSDMLGPLSPSGRIPGLGEGADGFFDPPNVDLDQYFDSNAFLNDGNFGDGNDFNFSLDPDGNNIGSGFDGGRVQDARNNDTPSPTGTEEIPRDDLGINDTPDRDNKRRRMG